MGRAATACYWGLTVYVSGWIRSHVISLKHSQDAQITRAGGVINCKHVTAVLQIPRPWISRSTDIVMVIIIRHGRKKSIRKAFRWSGIPQYYSPHNINSRPSRIDRKIFITSKFPFALIAFVSRPLPRVASNYRISLARYICQVVWEGL
mgnify:CR=1 FL=1